MKYYFKLRFNILCRKLTALGMPPIIGFIIGGIVFYYLSDALFNSQEHAAFIYLVIAFSILFKINNYKKSNFIKVNFSKLNFLKIQFFEKFITVLPLILFLIYKSEFLISLIMLSASIFAAFFGFKNDNTIYIPTPFSKKPFEFSVGFRKTFYLLPLCYGLSIISAHVGNFNLGIAALLSVFFITTTFYTKSEPNIYIWMYKYSPQEFIHYKVKQGVTNLILLLSPILITLAVIFPLNIGILLLLLTIASLALSVRILIKYTISSEGVMNLGQTISFYLSVIVFPFLLILLPYYHKQATHKLSKILS